MSKICFYNGYIYESSACRFNEGAVLCEDGIIKDISKGTDVCFDADEKINLEGKYLLPGFIDTHTHGRAGYDFNTASEEEIEIMLKSYVERGVTTVFPTLASDTFEGLLSQAKKINKFKGANDMAHVAGIHLEGRYLNPGKKGAHNEKLLAPLDANDIPEILKTFGLPLHVSAAFELDTNESFISALKESGATVGLAHTNADYKKTKELYEKYAISLTHMFNAMPPLHHREGGPLSVALVSDMYTELICDGIHVAKEIVKLAYKCKGHEKLVLITDSMEATDCPDGEYSIAGQPVIVKDSIARTLEGALAGSTLNLEDAINNLRKFADADILHAIHCATANPAKMLGIFDKYGSIEKGKNADFAVVDIDCGRIKVNKSYISVGL